MAAEAHARRRNAAVTVRQGDEEIDGEGGVLRSARTQMLANLVVCLDCLLDLLSALVNTGTAHLVLVTPVCALRVVWDRLGALELMERRGKGDDVPLARDVAGEALDRARDLVDLGKDNAWCQLVGNCVADARRAKQARKATHTRGTWRPGTLGRWAR